MAGLVRSGVDADAFGSKFKDTSGGFDAGQGKRTYTKPSYTLFVVGIPDAESSDSVAAVFERDRGYLQCRPVGHKTSRRMVFVDYDTIEAATKAMQAHQGHKWEDVDDGLKIDYDHDARCKRNTALDEGRYERFFPRGPRKVKAETDAALFARLRSEALMVAGSEPAARLAVVSPATPLQAMPGKARSGVSARLQVREPGAAPLGAAPAAVLEAKPTAAELGGGGGNGGVGLGLADCYDSSGSEDEEQGSGAEEVEEGDSYSEDESEESSTIKRPKVS